MKLMNMTSVPQSPKVVINGKTTYVTLMPKASIDINGTLDANWAARNEGAVKIKQEPVVGNHVQQEQGE